MIFSGVGLAASAESLSIRVGEPFPAVVLPSVEDGETMSLEAFRGQKLMLHIFASW